MTRLLIPDNCKTATTANTRYETVLNRSYQELAEYYGTAIVPARVRKPQDKSAAEASVRFAETWIIAALRDRKFFSIGEVNEAIAEKLEELNNRPFQWMAGTRRSAWLEEEKPYMLPLPAVPFEAAVWSVAKVPNDYLISDGRNKYSVPYNLIGEKVGIRVTKTAVEVFCHGSRVAGHRRLQTIQREPLVKLEHMPLAHQKYLAYNAGDFSRWAMSVGSMTVQYFLTSGAVPEQGCKACASLTKLGERYGRERLENGQDRPAKAAPPDKPNDSNRFGITRGVSYFRKGGDRRWYSSQLQDTSFNELGFEDRLGLLVTAEWNRRQTNAVKRLIHNAHFSAPSAAVEEIACYEDRKLDKAQMLRFFTCKFVDEGHHIILKGASGSPVSEAIMDRIIHNAYEVLVEGRVSMRERNGLKSSHAEGGVQDA